MILEVQWEAFCDELRRIGAEDVNLMDPAGAKCRTGGHLFEVSEEGEKIRIAYLDEDDNEGMWEWYHVDTLADAVKKIAGPSCL